MSFGYAGQGSAIMRGPMVSGETPIDSVVADYTSSGPLILTPETEQRCLSRTLARWLQQRRLSLTWIAPIARSLNTAEVAGMGSSAVPRRRNVHECYCGRPRVLVDSWPVRPPPHPSHTGPQCPTRRRDQPAADGDRVGRAGLPRRRLPARHRRHPAHSMPGASRGLQLHPCDKPLCVSSITCW